ncbi:MAG: hypothetical protein VB853_02915, partial [Pirellulales bacterium]
DVATLNGTSGTLNVTNPANRLTGVSRFEVGDDAKLIGTIGEESSALGSADIVLDGGTLSFAVEDDGGGGGASLPVVDKLEGWWDSTDLSTLFQDTAGTIPVTQTGDLVGLWMDKSPDVTTIANKDPWNFWQENNGRRPAWHETSMGGAPTLHLNEQCCDDGMKVHNAGGNPNFMPNDSIRDNSTVIVVDRYWGGTRGRTVMSGTGDNWLMNKHGGGQRMHGAGGWVSVDNANGDIPVNMPTVGVWTRGGGQAHFYLSGNGQVNRDYTQNTGVAGTPGTLAIGIEGNCCGGEQSQADIAEIIVYDKVLTAAERALVTDYLIDKYVDGNAVPGTGGAGAVVLDNTVVVTGDGTIDLGDTAGVSLSGLDMHVGSSLTIDSNEPERTVTFRDNIIVGTGIAVGGDGAVGVFPGAGFDPDITLKVNNENELVLDGEVTSVVGAFQGPDVIVNEGATNAGTVRITHDNPGNDAQWVVEGGVLSIEAELAVNQVGGFLALVDEGTVVINGVNATGNVVFGDLEITPQGGLGDGNFDPVVTNEGNASLGGIEQIVDGTIRSDSGTFTLGNINTVDVSNFQTGAHDAVIEGDGDIIVTGTIGLADALPNAVGGGIVKNGGGTLTLTGKSNFSGDALINSGKLTVRGPDGTLGAGANGVIGPDAEMAISHGVTLDNDLTISGKFSSFSL